MTSKKIKDENNYKYWRTATTKLIRDARKKYYLESVKLYKNDPKRLCKVFNELSNKSNFSNIKTLTYKNKIFTDDADIANTFNQYFTSVAEKYINKEKSLSPNLQKLEPFISEKLPKGNIFNIPYITQDFVYKYLTNLDNNKAAGIDNISSRIVKISAPVKWNESGFMPPLCTYRLNWARRTSWGWWDVWDDTVLQTQDSKFEPWRSEAEHATSRSRSLPTILTFTRGWGRNIFVSFKPPRPGTEPRTLAWKKAVLTTTLGPPPLSSSITGSAPVISKQLTDICNHSIRNSSFPAIWIKARVTPLHKRSATDNPENYRPISILPLLSTVIEKHVYNSLYEFLLVNNLYPQDNPVFAPNIPVKQHSLKWLMIGLAPCITMNVAEFLF